ncbi:serine protease, partial [Streptomyces sp. NPDC127079]
MRLSSAPVLIRPLILAAVAAVIPLAVPSPAAADSVVVGGFPIDVSQAPWTVALSSRDRFGGTRAGQFCGGVAIGRT